MSTEDLIQRCVHRDGPAWDEFVRKYQGLVTRTVRYKLSRMAVRASRSEVADIVQEIFLYLWEKVLSMRKMGTQSSRHACE